MVWATAIKGIKLLRLTLHWIPQPRCLVIYFGYASGETIRSAPLLPVVGRSGNLVYFSPLNWCIFRRSRFDGLPWGEGLKAIPALRSAATLARNSRLASVSR